MHMGSGMSGESYTYYAFVSHSHRDARWATWIQNALERYRLPSAVRRVVNRPLPKSLAPVFRDATDLGVCQLVEGLHRELKASRFLIVVCSPDSAKPNGEGKHYVNDEVDYFVGLGRADRIIPVLVRGTPEESFCPKIRELGLLAVDAAKTTRARILNDIVAKILGLRPDELWRREQRRLRWKRVILMLATALVVGVGWYGWDWTREKTAYFADYIDRFGVYEGLCPLSPEQIVGREQAYRFHYQGYDSLLPGIRRPVLREVFCVNSHDRIRNEANERPLHPQAAGFRFYYDEMMSIAKVEHLEVDGTVKAMFFYSGEKADIVDVVRRGEDGRLGTVARSHPIGGTGIRRAEAVEIGRYRIVRDDHGLVLRMEGFRDARGTPVADRRGVFRTDYRIDGMGRVVAESYYSWDGQKAPCRSGADEMRYAYDEAGNVVESLSVRDGKPILRVRRDYDAYGNCRETKRESHDAACPVQGWTVRRCAYDGQGEVVRCEHFDVDGKAAKCTDSRWDRKVRFEDGRLVRDDVSYFDEKGEAGERDGVARCVTRYDVNMRHVEIVRYGKDGKLLDSPRQAAGIVRKFDKDGRLVEYSATGANNQGWSEPGQQASGYSCQYGLGGDFLIRTMRYFRLCGTCLRAARGSDHGASCEKSIYDKTGRVVSVSLFGADDKAMVGAGGWHVMKFKYDQYGFMSEVAFHDMEGKPVLADGFGEYGAVAAVRFVNDAAGNVLEFSLFGADERPMIGSRGYATVKQTFDSRGRVTGQSSFGVEGNPVESTDGVFRRQYQYDDSGRKCRARVFDLAGTYRELRYDAGGNVIRDAYFSADGLPRADENGVHVTLYRRDSWGREVKRGYLDIRGQPVLNEDRIAGLATTYNGNGAPVEVARFGTQGELVMDKNGVCIIRWEYDASRREIGRIFYDTRTNRVQNTTGGAGVRKSYDERGNLTEEFNVDCEDRPIPDKFGVCIVHADFDDCRRVVRKTFFNGDRQPVLSTEGIGGWTSKYDDCGHETERRFFGLDGKPCKTVAGFAAWVNEYDKCGNVIRHVQVDEAGNLVLGADGTAGWLRKYDAQNRCIEERYVGQDGKPCGSRVACADVLGLGIVEGNRAEASYDAQGRKTETVVLGRSVGGVSRLVFKHDLAGDIAEVRVEDDKGALTGLSNGVARVVSKHNDFRELTERQWFDVDGRPCAQQGVFRLVVRTEHLLSGVRRRISNYDADGFPTDGGDGVALRVEEFDREYRIVRAYALDVNGNPTCLSGTCGYARLEAERNERGLLTKIVLLDAKGEGAVDGIARVEICYSFAEDGSLTAAASKGYDVKGKLLREHTLSRDEALKINQNPLLNLRYTPIK